MPALLAYTDDALLARHSGYHVIANYLPECEKVVTPRREPSSLFGRIRSKVLRRLSFSRWCAGGSFEMEAQINARIEAGYAGCVHYLWCDRDMAFLDRRINPSSHPLIGTFHQCADILPEVIRRVSSLWKFAAIIIMSETQRRWFEEHGVEADRIHRILHGVDVDYFRPAEQVKDDGFRVLAVGGTRRNFGLLQSVAATLQQERAIQFEVVGPTDRKAMFGGMNNLVYHDRLSDADLLSKYQSASCLLHLIEDSTANNVVNEALACGAAVVSECHGGVPEYVTEDCAVLCSPGDGDEVVNAIKRLARDDRRLSEMRLAAREHAMTLDWRHSAIQLEQLYSGLSS